eukprot:Blabericola_migrator_1__5476@NODE_2799_length_2339_cov_136_812940_g997_i1_p3_GENE_NODE_2799_length_2339_cov_136_812940_g997_i1NODE_2799_length_2339_cov_136_812940_g997_i1_p3_ORF_typecomplete_len124_score7_31_NODE_2799_length_2339_cov_136_812940_g997_i116942065
MQIEITLVMDVQLEYSSNNAPDPNLIAQQAGLFVKESVFRAQSEIFTFNHLPLQIFEWVKVSTLIYFQLVASQEAMKVHHLAKGHIRKAPLMIHLSKLRTTYQVAMGAQRGRQLMKLSLFAVG